MRGVLRGRPLVSLVSLLVVLGMLGPVVAAALDATEAAPPAELGAPAPRASSAPTATADTNLQSTIAAGCAVPGPCTSWEEVLAWSETAPVQEVARVMQDLAASGRPSLLPTPDRLPGHAEWPIEAQREAWRAWLLASRVEALAEPLQTRSAMLNAMQEQVLVSANGDAPDGPPAGLGEPRGLKGVWRMDAHGTPREVLPAGPQGATFLVTYESVLFFPEAGADPEWMIRPKQGLGGVQTARGAGDVHDLVIRTWANLFTPEPGIIVVDGTTGEIVFRGFGGSELLAFYTVTDVDGDGADDILGIDVSGNVVAAHLDGAIIYRKPLPEVETEGVGLPFLPLYFGMLHEHYLDDGLFADVNGDGTKDIVVPGEYWLRVEFLLDMPMPALSAYSGKDLAPIWVTEPDPFAGSGFSFLYGAGDVDGDGREEVLLMEFRWSDFFVMGTESIAVVVRSGEDGEILSRDAAESTCITFLCETTGAESFYFPLGLFDLAEGGGKEILGFRGVEGAGGGPMQIQLVVRRPGGEPGGASDQIARHDLSLNDQWIIAESFFIREGIPEGGDELLIALSRVEPESRVVATEVIRLSGAGFEQTETQEFLGLIDRDPVTGTLYGWLAKSDRWGPLDAEYGLDGNGMRIMVSAYPLLFEDRNRDGVPDVLVPRSIGYRWLDGRSGEFLEELDRPVTRFGRGAYQDAGRTVILEGDFVDHEEHEWEGFYLVDLRGNPVWSVPPQERTPAYYRGLLDLTGNGRLELLLQKPGQMSGSAPYYSFTPGEYMALRMPGQEEIWSQSVQDVGLRFLDAIPGRSGIEVILITPVEGTGHHQAAVWVVGEEKARLSVPMSEFWGGTTGYLLLVPPDTAPGSFDIVDGRTGETVHTENLPEPSANGTFHFGPRFIADVTGDGTADLVQMLRMTRNTGESGFAQSVHVVDWTRNRTAANFTLLDAPVQNHEISFGGEVYSYTTLQTASFSRLVGDWDRDGLADLALREQGWPTVRSMRTGEPLAVGPASGTFGPIVDLNGDTRAEVGLLQGARLRFFTDAAGALLDEEADAERVADPSRAGKMEQGADEIFKRQPGPAPLLLVGLVLFGTGLLRRRVQR